MNRKEYGRRFPMKPIERQVVDLRPMLTTGIYTVPNPYPYWIGDPPYTGPHTIAGDYGTYTHFAAPTTTVNSTVELVPGTLLADVGADGSVIGIEYLRGAA